MYDPGIRFFPEFQCIGYGDDESLTQNIKTFSVNSVRWCILVMVYESHHHHAVVLLLLFSVWVSGISTLLSEIKWWDQGKSAHVSQICENIRKEGK